VACGFLFFAGGSAWGCSCDLIFAASSPCKGLKAADAIFVGRAVSSEGLPVGAPVEKVRAYRFRFAVEENISGIKDAEVYVGTGRGNGDCGFRFKVGEQYVVYASKDDDGEMSTNICAGTRRADEAVALIPQLRAMRDGKKVSSVFGILRRTQQFEDSVRIEGYDHVLPDVRVVLKSGSKSFEAVTDENGAYAIFGVPAGKYLFSASLPPNLEIAIPSLDLAPKACWENDLDAMSAGRIRGRLIFPDGWIMPYAPVQLFRVEDYRRAGSVWETYQRAGETYFEFEHVTPGKYILVFNDKNSVTSEVPFPRSFYPGMTDRESAVQIEVGEGQQVLDANIKLSGGRPNRKVVVNLEVDKKDKPIDIELSAHAADGSEKDFSTFGLKPRYFILFRDTDYTITATANCGIGMANAAKEGGSPRLVNQVVEVRGPVEYPNGITFVFGPCK
jgi:hypothetical protein